MALGTVDSRLTDTEFDALDADSHTIILTFGVMAPARGEITLPPYRRMLEARVSHRLSARWLAEQIPRRGREKRDDASYLSGYGVIG